MAVMDGKIYVGCDWHEHVGAIVKEGLWLMNYGLWLMDYGLRVKTLDLRA